jgi:hypothetical protein
MPISPSVQAAAHKGRTPICKDTAGLLCDFNGTMNYKENDVHLYLSWDLPLVRSPCTTLVI